MILEIFGEEFNLKLRLKELVRKSKRDEGKWKGGARLGAESAGGKASRGKYEGALDVQFDAICVVQGRGQY